MYQSRNVISDEPAAWCTLRTLWVEQRCMCPDLVCAQHTKLLTPMAEPLAAVLFVIFIGNCKAGSKINFKVLSKISGNFYLSDNSFVCMLCIIHCSTRAYEVSCRDISKRYSLILNSKGDYVADPCSLCRTSYLRTWKSCD